MLIYIEERLIKCYSIHGSSKRLCGLFLVSELTILLLRSQNYCLFLQSKMLRDNLERLSRSDFVQLQFDMPKIKSRIWFLDLILDYLF